MEFHRSLQHSTIWWMLISAFCWMHFAMSELMHPVGIYSSLINGFRRCERLDEVWTVFWNCKAMRCCTLKHVSKLDPVQIIQNQFLLDFGEGLALPNPLLMLNHQASLFIEV
ncbi:hypothetical protein Peur_009374 [Populus x canadensis]